MLKTKYIQIRVSPEQYERIKNKACSRGYKTLTSFLTNLALERDLVLEKRLEEMCEHLKRLLKKKELI